MAEIKFSIDPALRTATAVTDRHFGVQFEAGSYTAASLTNAFSKIAPDYVRFPGGFHTERSFDVTQPNSTTNGLKETLSGFLAAASAAQQKTIMGYQPNASLTEAGSSPRPRKT
ncbi:hypothetical protein G5V65_12820 [Rhodobacter sp. HX-7-19]|uniref:Uncharacterized protein n=1 Tax=Paragemmobacter kunshanensis TaxID=2583234 RepID=A0A6M1UA96_9RHOB|nr:hypothetical protein [Rhodobacter kunshanensis]NGQ91781.1 hypothetical protein [Rhodobacter kunshanensis]